MVENCYYLHYSGGSPSPEKWWCHSGVRGIMKAQRRGHHPDCNKRINQEGFLEVTQELSVKKKIHKIGEGVESPGR